MNRGIDGKAIFFDNTDKEILIDIMRNASTKTRIPVMAFCIQNNHYHLLIQNSSERMADFFQLLNGEYAVYFRKKYGGKGYVFQDRYKTKLIQDEAYLMICLAYILNNPVNSGVCKDFLSYRWSSAQAYFNEPKTDFPYCTFFETLFENRQAFITYINANSIDELPMIKSELGWIVGGEAFIPKAVEKAERRGRQESSECRRKDDFYFEPVEKIIFEFEKTNGIKINDIATYTHKGKKLRGKLLVQLKDLAGLRYREIIKMDLFGDIKRSSLGSIYKLYKKKD